MQTNLFALLFEKIFYIYKNSKIKLIDDVAEREQVQRANSR